MRTLSAAEREDAEASVAKRLAEMAAENARRRDWYRQPVDGWRDGRLKWRNVVTGEMAIVDLRPQPRAAE